MLPSFLSVAFLRVSARVLCICICMHARAAILGPRDPIPLSTTQLRSTASSSPSSDIGVIAPGPIDSIIDRNRRLQGILQIRGLIFLA